MIMTQHKISVVITQVKTIAFAVTKHIAIGTFTFAHPLSVAIEFKSVLPNIPKTIFIDLNSATL